jgi:hypothetical protein
MGKKNKPALQLEDEGSTYDDQQVQQETQREKVPFSTLLRPSLYERLKAAAFWEDESIAELTATAIRKHLKDLEEERDEPFEVLPPHEV